MCIEAAMLLPVEDICMGGEAHGARLMSPCDRAHCVGGRASAPCCTHYTGTHAAPQPQHRSPQPPPHKAESMQHADKKKIFRRKRYTLAATWRDTTVPCRPDTPLPPSHSSPSRLLFQAAFCGGMVSELRALQQPGQEY
eukprot:scaffold6778_cov129-Isochrysis_galbana.AAC.4